MKTRVQWILLVQVLVRIRLNHLRPLLLTVPLALSVVKSSGTAAADEAPMRTGFYANAIRDTQLNVDNQTYSTRSFEYWDITTIAASCVRGMFRGVVLDAQGRLATVSPYSIAICKNADGSLIIKGWGREANRGEIIPHGFAVYVPQDTGRIRRDTYFKTTFEEINTRIDDLVNASRAKP